MLKYVEVNDVCKEIDKGDLLVGNNADWAKEIVRRTLPADVKKVIYGTWKTREDHNDYLWVECSYCGFEVQNHMAAELGTSSTDLVRYKWHFCPCCGANMRKEGYYDKPCY